MPGDTDPIWGLIKAWSLPGLTCIFLQMFGDIRKLNELRITMLIEPLGDWVAGSPQLPTGDSSGNYADAGTTYDFCYHLQPSHFSNTNILFLPLAVRQTLAPVTTGGPRASDGGCNGHGNACPSKNADPFAMPAHSLWF